MIMKNKLKKLSEKYYTFRNKEKKSTVVVYVLLRLAVLVSLVFNVLQGNWENVFMCFLTLVLFLIPFIAEETFEVDIPPTMQIIMLLFIFSAEILGEIKSFYLKYEYWDTMLHTINGFLMGAIGFALIDLLNRTEKYSLKLTPFFVVFTAFCFSMTTGVVWEFFEFGLDKYIGTDCQKDVWIKKINTVEFDETKSNTVTSFVIDEVEINGEEWPAYLDIGLIDTMKDMFVNLIGAIVFSIIGFVVLKNRDDKKINNILIKKRTKVNC